MIVIVHRHLVSLFKFLGQIKACYRKNYETTCCVNLTVTRFESQTWFQLLYVKLRRKHKKFFMSFSFGLKLALILHLN